jgi:hypothetical protein
MQKNLDIEIFKLIEAKQRKRTMKGTLNVLVQYFSVGNNRYFYKLENLKRIIRGRPMHRQAPAGARA